MFRRSLAVNDSKTLSNRVLSAGRRNNSRQKPSESTISSSWSTCEEMSTWNSTYRKAWSSVAVRSMFGLRNRQWPSRRAELVLRYARNSPWRLLDTIAQPLAQKTPAYFVESKVKLPSWKNIIPRSIDRSSVIRNQCMSNCTRRK